MKTNKQDAEQFMQVFIVFSENGRIIPYNPTYYEYAIKNIDEYTLQKWTEYLRRQSRLLSDDEFFDWYDNMSFDTISLGDLSIFDLPTEQIVLPLGNEEIFITGIHQFISDWYDSCNVTSKDNAIVSMTFNKALIDVTYDILTGCDQSLAKHIKESFKILLENVQALVEKFNNAQGPNGVHVEKFHIARSRDVSTRAYINENNKLIKSINARGISLSTDDLFYCISKTSAKPEYIERFFNIIEDCRVKGMEDPGQISQEKYTELTGEKELVTI